MHVYDINGRLITHQQALNIDRCAAPTQAGTYILVLKGKDGMMARQQFVVQ